MIRTKVEEMSVLRRLVLVSLLVLAVAGIVIGICSITKTIPGYSNIVATVLSYVIAYGGFVTGPILSMLAIGSFIEVWKGEE